MSENQTTLREALNEAAIEGILQELRLEEKKVDDKLAITGEIDIRINENSVHTVNVFSYKLTQEGKESGIFKGLNTVKNEYKSIASYNEEEADRVSITAGKLGVNEYFVQEELKTYPQLSTNFINRLKPNDEFKPRAKFEAEVYIKSVKDEMKNDEETGRILVDTYIPLYKGKIIPFRFIVADPHAVEYVRNNYESGTTAFVYGDIINEVHVNTKKIEGGFGKPQEKIKRTTVREYVITGGSTPYDEDDAKAYKKEVIKKALTEREIYLEEKKNKKEAPKVQKKGFDTKGSSATKKTVISDDDLPF
ncbi:hypothetical protein [Brevibacillus laterosporus]|uniref:hypothetical protein n=1 Tax=Brevibacillus laterosporus TaxID=1465 RepID=UPI000E6B933A|nr:hypothetical protein [Brevibacillus laterosporus]AYB37619.1 hypothetical protein D5F52_04600 [Brevibacillus laterosporus]MBM7110862.1 hypothetical protein [Brevibacillus laterosporus]